MADGPRSHPPDLPPPVPLADRRGDRGLRDRPAGGGPGAPRPGPGGTLISAKTTEAPSLEPVLEQALGRIRLDPHLLQPPRRVVGRRQAGAVPGGVVDDERRREDLDLQAAPRRQVPQRPRVRGRRRQVQLRAHPRPQGGARAAAATSRPSTPWRRRTSTRVRVHTKQPSASLLAGMAGGWSSIIPKEVVEEKGDLRRTAVGTGPFIFQEWVPQSHLKARKNPDYWDKGKPYVDALELKVIPGRGEHHRPAPHRQRPPRPAGGQQELPPGQGRQAAHRPPGARGSASTWSMINHGRKPFTDVRVRQAISLAVDRTEVLQAAASGLGSVTGPLTPAMKPVGAARGGVQGVVHAEPGAREEAPGRRRLPAAASRRRSR